MIRHRLPRFLVALVAMLAIAGTATTANAQDKLDRALREGQRSGRAQRVIVKAKPGYEAWARQLLAQNGKDIDGRNAEHQRLAVELAAGELDTLQALGVRRLLGRLLCVAEWRRRGSGQLQRACAVNTLLGTLGPVDDDASFGYGVTVALIDSGIYPLGGLRGPHQGFLRLHRWRHLGAPAVRRLRPRHARRRPDRRPAGLLGRRVSRAWRPRSQFVGLKVLDRERRRPHERRHPRHRVCDRQQAKVRHRHHQPLARPPDLRTGGDRPAGAGGREGYRGRHHRRCIGGQPRRECRR